MTLTLRIENLDRLADGGPLWFSLEWGALSVGRSRAMGWVLPDPARHVSGHHFDVNAEADGYWLTDMSTNGTFLQGRPHRLEGRHRLSHGERLMVGPYILRVEISAPNRAPDPMAGQPPVTPPIVPPPIVPPPIVPPPMPPQPEGDPWDFGADLPPVDPQPRLGARPSGLDAMQDFLSMPPAIGAAVGGAGPGLVQPPPMQPPIQPPPIQPQHRPQAMTPPGMPGGMPVGVPVGVPPALPPIGQMPPPLGVTPQPPAPQPPIPQPLVPQTPAQTPLAATSAAPGDMAARLHQAFCRGAGLDPRLSPAPPDPEAQAEQLGLALRLVTEEIMAMLRDRANVKQFTRGGDRTLRAALGNNPMKFLPDSAEALTAMFLQPRPGYLQGPESLAEALKDLRGHQMAIFAALQPALTTLLAGLSPDEIEAAEAETGGMKLLGRGAGKRWETYLARWDAKAQAGDHGMLDVFLQAFAEAYARATGPRL